MMYKNKLAVALKSAGKVLREFKDSVYVPFGSEYSIYIKNLNTVRALCKVTVDGVDVGDGTRFVVNPNDTIDIERFIKNGNLDEGNRLKFIERTGAIENHRGIDIEDGLVRVEFQFEKPFQALVTNFKPQRRRWNDRKDRRWDDPWYNISGSGQAPLDLIGGNSAGGTTTSTGAPCGAAPEVTCDSFSVAADNAVSVNYSVDTVETQQRIANSDVNELVNDIANEAGITVPGSISDQEFKTASWFPTETETHVVVLHMLGQTEDNVEVTKAVTVKSKPTCETCGRKNKATAKFCTECGTSLTIV